MQRKSSNRALKTGFLLLLILSILYFVLLEVLNFNLVGLIVFCLVAWWAIMHLPALLAPAVAAASLNAEAQHQKRFARGPRGKAQAAASWTNVILPGDTKTELMTLQRILLDPQGYEKRWGMNPPTGAILYGPPGTGKTLIARTLAESAGYAFLAPSPAELSNKWMGESEKAIANLYAQARQNAPAVVFFDELDSVAAGRSNTGGDSGGAVRSYNNLTNQLLQEIDGFRGCSDIFTIGATNRLDILDDALISRLSMQVYVALPDQVAREHLFALYTAPFRDRLRVDVRTLAKRSERLSGREIQEGCKRAVLIAESQSHETVGESEFNQAFKRMFGTIHT